MEVAQHRVVEISEIALGFPSLPGRMVVRDNLLHTIDQIFDRDYEVVLLDGAAGSGRTTALAQFCSRHSRVAFSLFLRPASELAYDSAYCRYDLANQVAWHLTGVSLADKQYPTAAEYRNLLHRLSQYARRTRTIYYFAVDGLADIPASATGARSALIDQLPLGLPYIRFLMTGNADGIPELRGKKIRYREQLISPFSIDETSALFRDVIDDPRTLSDLQRRFSTHPGKLASLRRILDHRKSPPDIIGAIDASEQSLCRIEWEQDPPVDLDARFALAAIAHLPSASDLDTLAKIAERPTTELRNSLANLPYVLIDDQRGIVRFASEGLRSHAKLELKDLEREVIKRAVSIFSNRPVDASVIQVLPELLERQGNVRGYLEFLNRDNLVAIFCNMNSLLSLAARLKQGQVVAEELTDSELATQFSLDRASIKELLECSVSRTQVEATLQLYGIDEAIKLAHSQVTLEDRLHALSVVAKLQRTAGGIDPTLAAEIQRLCDLLQPEHHNDRVVEIASIVMHFDPALAFSLLKRGAHASDDANGLDQAIANLSARSLMTSEESQPSAVRALNNVIKEAQSDQAERFSALIGLFADSQDIESILAESARLTRTSEKLSILQQWIRRHHKHKRAFEVSGAIVKAVLDDTKYSPNASVFRDATLPLANDFAPDSRITDLVAFTDSQKIVLKSVGPVVDYFRTRFHLARAEICTKRAGLAPLEGDALEVDDVGDANARMICLAWLHATIQSLRDLPGLTDDLGIQDYAKNETRKAVMAALSQSAEHVEVMKPVLRALAGIDDQLTCELIGLVNTADRRDFCCRLSAKYARLNPFWQDSASAGLMLSEFYEGRSWFESTKEGIRSDYLNWIAAETKALRISYVFGLRDLEIARKLKDPLEKARTIAALVSSGSISTGLDFSSTAAEILREAVDAAETPALRRIAAYVAAVALNGIDESLSQRYFLAAGGPAFSPDYSEALAVAVAITLRAYSGLVRLRAASDNDWLRAKGTLDSIDCPITRCALAGDLVTGIATADRDKARDVARGYVRPVIEQFQREEKLRQPMVSRLVATVAPALWLTHPAHALQLVNMIEPDDSDLAYDNILKFIIHGRQVGEPYQKAAKRSAEISDEIVSDALFVLEAVSGDGTFYYSAAALLQAMRDKINLGRISRIQAAEFRRRIEAMANSKLPSPTGVQHEGYLILISAQLMIDDKPSANQWAALVERARRLSNRADAAFVCAKLAGLIPAKNVDWARSAFNIAADIIPSLPLVEDQIDRSETLLEEAWHLGPERCKQLVRASFLQSFRENRSTVKERQLALIEAVYAYDEELAASLSSLAEKQKTSGRVRGEISEHLSLIKLGKEVAGRTSDEIDKSKVNELVDACQQTLGRLNGGMVVQASMPELRRLLLRAGQLSLSEGYWAHAYVTEACYRRYRTSKEGPEYMRALYDAYHGSTTLVCRLVEYLKQRGPSSFEREKFVSNDLHIAVQPGGRQIALDWVRAWLAENKPSEVTIVDPYFGVDDLSALEIIHEQVHECELTVLTTVKGRGNGNRNELREQYRLAWRRISLGDPPNTQIVVVSSDSDAAAELHDRWWLGEKNGLSFGTSFNSLGAKLSEIQVLDFAACSRVRAELEPYLRTHRRSRSGARLTFDVFDLA